MRIVFTRKVGIALVCTLLVAGALIVLLPERSPAPTPTAPEPVTVEPIIAAPTWPGQEIIGTSIEGRSIEAYTYGNGTTHLLFVGGVHGGYEWNSVLLAYQFLDYLNANKDAVPAHLTVTVIPSLNPDGVFAVTGVEGRFTVGQVNEDLKLGTGRFNARGVDLNRNFDCKWKPESMWRGNVVSAGAAPFSEPEAAALRDFVAKQKPTAVVFWHSQSNAVYASECHDGILPGTRTLMSTYAAAAKYPAVDTFDAYPVTGDAEGWLASIGIPAVTVELSTHETIEWERNLAGFTAVLAGYKEESSLAQ